MTQKKDEKTIAAYQFMVKKESKNEPFSISELEEVTSWRPKTIKTYIAKQWSDFIERKKDGLYYTKGLLTISLGEFIRLHSQKEKYKSHLYKENEVLLVKAKQFALLAVYVYNNPYSDFKTYGYIINMIIAWTSLFHALFQREKIDFFQKNRDGTYKYVDNDKKAWELSTCIKEFWVNENNPTKSNLTFLIGLRNNIEHRWLPIIDLKIAGHCQACISNFERFLCDKFGREHALKQNISLAIQLSRFQQQKIALRDIQKLHIDPIVDYMDSFESKLPPHFLESPEYRVSYFLTPKVSKSLTSADETIEFTDLDFSSENKAARVLIKETEKEKFKPGQIVKMMQEEGFKKFTQRIHTNLWQQKKAKTNSAYGIMLSDNSWYWYPCWIEEVRKYCKENEL